MRPIGKVLTLLVGISIPLTVRAYEFDPGDVIARTTGLSTKSPKDTTVAIVQYVLGLLALVAVVLLIWAGFEWMTAGGNEEQVKKAKDRIRFAIIGLAIVLLSWALTSFVLSTLTNVTA